MIILNFLWDLIVVCLWVFAGFVIFEILITIFGLPFGVIIGLLGFIAYKMIGDSK